MENVIIEFKDKKNSSGTIKNGKIILRISNRLSAKEQKRHITQLLERFHKQLAKQPRTSAQKLQTGECINFYGIKQLWLNLKATEKNRTQISLDKDTPFLNIKYPQALNSTELKTKITKKITELMEPELKELIRKINRETINKELKTISFRNFHSRWGHCNYRTKSITLSTKLAWTPYECFEYVIIHELCHLIEPNHSAAFWALVEEHCPNYKSTKKQLLAYQ